MVKLVLDLEDMLMADCGAVEVVLLEYIVLVVKLVLDLEDMPMADCGAVEVVLLE